MPRGQPPPLREGLKYPLFRTNDRPLPADYTGPLYVWDIDNTYLLTEWASTWDLIRIRFEAAVDKKPIPGAVALLRALRRGTHDDSLRVPIYFVSASPETMRTVLEKRMLLDGVEHDGATFRDLWTATGRPHLRHLRDVYGYKIAALLLYRLENPPGARETLFGDDREHDPEVYVLYSRACSGAIRGTSLEEILVSRGVRKPDARYIRLLADDLPAHDPVERIVIRHVGHGHAARAGDAGAGGGTPFDADDARILRVDDYAQAAAVLRAIARIDADGFALVASAVRAEGGDGDVEPVLAALSGKIPAEAADRVRREIELLEPGRPPRYGPPRPPEEFLAVERAAAEAAEAAEAQAPAPAAPALPTPEAVAAELAAEARELEAGGDDDAAVKEPVPDMAREGGSA